MQLPVLQDHPVLGEFGKAIEGSRSINFGVSGGKHCDRACRHHPNTTADHPTHMCYAVRSEKRPDRAELLNKLERHEVSGPVRVVKQGFEEIKDLVVSGHKPPWLRFSTNGSVPNPVDASPTFLKVLNEMLEYCDEQEIPVHFPVETGSKALFYRRAVGWRVVVRESAQTIKRFLETPGPVSCVAGESGMNQVERVDACRLIAKMRTKRMGRKCVVCPAVASRYLNDNQPQPKAKCGNCTACARADWDIVYPLH